MILIHFIIIIIIIINIIIAIITVLLLLERRILDIQCELSVKTYFLWKENKLECRLLQILLGALRVNVFGRKTKEGPFAYHIYPKYWVPLTPYHTCPKKWKKSISLPVDGSKIVLEEWQTV